MISPKMRKWVEKNYKSENKGGNYYVYMNRIQHKIDKELDGLCWFCAKYPEIFMDYETEINDVTGKIVTHRRLRNYYYA